MSDKSNLKRREWMGFLARASTSTLSGLVAQLAEDLPLHSDLRSPEIGMIMVRGRISGAGDPFNLGEMTVTRCSVIVGGFTGHSLVQGRRQDHARLAALIDAMLQDPDRHDRLYDAVIKPLAQAEIQNSAAKAKTAAETKVDFFTMVRGENEL